MTRYLDIKEQLLCAIADGVLTPGAALASVREQARNQSTAPATVARAYQELARAGIVVSASRRVARVAPDGPALARRQLRGGGLRLAGSDDPLLDLLLTGAGDAIVRRGAGGSFGGLGALWRMEAEAATLHLWHADGDHNAPYARRVLAGRRPTLVRLWKREQGIVVAAGNPEGIIGVEDLARVTVAERAIGTGTRALSDRLLRERELDPTSARGPEVGSHLEVALAVAAGVADAGLAVRAAATTLGLDFIPLAWEPFELALGADRLDGLEPLLALLARPELAGRAAQLGGYDLDGSGVVRVLD